MRSLRNTAGLLIIATALASCARPEKPMPAAKPARVGGSFDDVGKVTMHEGQPCTSQIMFDFRGGRSIAPVWLAARMNETKMLNDAVAHRKRVHIWGNWKRSKAGNCN